jgi:MFS family permease
LLGIRALFAPGAIFSFKDFRRVFLSSSIMSIGGGALPMALAIVIIDSGGSATTLGLVLAAKMLSSTGFVVVGGVWADRLKRKHVMISADLSRGILILLLVFVAAPETPRYWMALIVFLIGIGEAFGAPASGAIISSILPEDLLKQGNVFRGAVARLGGIIGPAIGVFSVAIIGARYTFLVTAFACFISVLSLTGVKESAHVAKESHEPFFEEMKDGLRTVREMPWVGALILMASFQLLVVVSSEHVLLPVITKSDGDGNSCICNWWHSGFNSLFENKNADTRSFHFDNLVAICIYSISTCLSRFKVTYSSGVHNWWNFCRSMGCILAICSAT